MFGFYQRQFNKRQKRFVYGTCSHCGHTGKLECYRTDLHLYFLFMDLLPNNTVQVIEFCPKCKQTLAVNSAQWDNHRLRTLSISADRGTEQPLDPQIARDHFRNLITFGDYTQAQELAEFMEHNIVADLENFRALAVWYELIERPHDLKRCDEKATQLSGHNPSLFNPNINPNFETRVVGTQALAATICGDARSNVMGDRSSKSPVKRIKRPRSLSCLASTGLLLLAALTLLLFAELFFLHNIFPASSRTVYIVNGYSEDMDIQLDDQLESVTIHPGEAFEHEMATGQHRLTIINPISIARDKEFVIPSEWFRQSNPHTVVVDPIESTILQFGRGIQSGRETEFKPIQTQCGTLVSEFPGINRLMFDPQFRRLLFDTDYRIRVFGMHPADVVGHPNIPSKAKRSYFESRLALDPTNGQTASAFIEFLKNQNATSDLNEFLSSQIDLRPINIGVHLNYISAMAAKGENTTQLYDELLQSEPDNAQLLMLRSTLETTTTTARVFLDKALQLAPAAWEIRAAAIQNHLSEAAFTEAVLKLKEAPRLPSADHEIMFVMSPLFAVGNLEAITPNIPMYPRTLADFELAVHYYKRKNLEQKLEFMSISFITPSPRQEKDTRALGGLIYYYVISNMGAYLESATALADEAKKHQALFCYSLEMGDLSGALQLAETLKNKLTIEQRILLAVLLKENDSTEIAQFYWEQVATEWSKGTPAKQVAAQSMANIGDQPADLESLRTLALPIKLKRALATGLLRFSETRKPEVVEFVRLLNFDLRFPHNFIERQLDSFDN